MHLQRLAVQCTPAASPPQSPIPPSTHSRVCGIRTRDRHGRGHHLALELHSTRERTCQWLASRQWLVRRPPQHRGRAARALPRTVPGPHPAWSSLPCQPSTQLHSAHPESGCTSRAQPTSSRAPLAVSACSRKLVAVWSRNSSQLQPTSGCFSCAARCDTKCEHALHVSKGAVLWSGRWIGQQGAQYSSTQLQYQNKSGLKCSRVNPPQISCPRAPHVAKSRASTVFPRPA